MNSRTLSRWALLACVVLAACLPAAGSAATGGRITFMGNASGNFDIYTMNSDGSGMTDVTNSPFSDQPPSWSPDRSKIAFSTRIGGNRDIYVINADGSGLLRITIDGG